MHKFLRAVGFSNLKTRKDIQNLIVSSIQIAKEKAYTSAYEEADGTSMYAEYRAEFAPGIGICVRGEFDENNRFIYEYYIPYLSPQNITTVEDVTIERHTEKLSYAGVVDDYKVGVSIIFYLQNIITYMKLNGSNQLPIKGTTLSLAGLSDRGKILLPINKDEHDIRLLRKYDRRKNQMIAAAKNGDEDAIEDLTIQDMDTYSVLQKKIHGEDILSLVDTYFIPYGMECDLYSILGEITSVEKVQNKITMEYVYKMTLNVNDLIFDVCINEIDLLGEPEVGRRFKGVVWLQGYINFPE